MGRCLQEALLSQQLPEPMDSVSDDSSDTGTRVYNDADEDGWGQMLNTRKFLSLNSDDDVSTTPSTEDLNGSSKAKSNKNVVGKWNEQDSAHVVSRPNDGAALTLGLEDLYAQ